MLDDAAADQLRGPNDEKSSENETLSPSAIFSMVSRDGAFLPYSMSTRNDLSMPITSANFRNEILRSMRNCLTRSPKSVRTF